MESLIPVIGKLQDVFAAVGSRDNEVQLPQIVVVGSQSAGKSSVIEGIVGRDFLPRGSGIVTRRPLLIHLYHTPMDSEQRDRHKKLTKGDWATFEHVPNKFFTDFEKVREEIDAETNRVTGTNKGISNQPINLKIYSANVVTLSLIDLPGITKVPVGDQPQNIEILIRQMILQFISNPQSLILAVTPANQDFANSEALKLAREVDANGDRTLCVLTKLDLMDRGTDAMAVLRGEIIPVKLGIIGVVNRSQEDIDANKSVTDCINDELSFLCKKYPTLASKNGIQYLAKTLSKLLHHHIRESLPQLKHRISKMITEFDAILSGMGDPIVDQKKTFLQVINNFSSAYVSTLDGNAQSDESAKLSGGARVCEIFYTDFAKDIGDIESMGDLKVEEVLSSIKNGSGLKPAMFIPERSFHTLVIKQMKRFKRPMLRCVDLVHEELLRIIQNCGEEITREMQRFPLFYDRIRKVVTTILSTRIIKTKQFVEDLLDNELAFINTKHPEFIIGEELLKAFNEDPDNALEQMRNGTYDAESKLTKYFGKLSTHDKRDFLVIERLIDQYFCIVKQSIKDKVPKAIMNFLVKYIMEHLQSELTAGLYDQTNVDELLVESGNMTQRRNETDEMLKALNKANDVLSEIRDTEIW